MQLSRSAKKTITLILALSLALVSLLAITSMQASGSDSVPLMYYQFGDLIPIDDDEAGIEGTTGKSPAIPGEEPWLAGLIYIPGKSRGFGYFCAGTKIAPQWILTAAHCLEDIKPNQIEIILGRFSLASDEGDVIPAKAFYVHSQWQADGFFSNDIALIELERPSQAGASLAPITAATAQFAEPGDMSRTVGWGLLGFLDTEIPEIPYGADFPITTEAACKAGYENEVSIDGRTICAGYLRGQSSSCQGDSGSSLTVKSDDGSVSYQAGIVSGGAGCGWISKYGVYTRVSAFNDWVARAMSGNPNPADTDVIQPLTQPPDNFLGFTLKELPFGFTFTDGFADEFEVLLLYVDDNGNRVIIDAFKEEFANTAEFLDEAGIELTEGDLITIDGIQVFLTDFGDFTSALYVKNGNLVFVDGEVSIGQIRTIAETVIRNSN